MTDARGRDGVVTARIVAVALMTGPAMLWAISWFLTTGGTRPISGAPVLSSAVAFVTWAVIAAGAFASALFARRVALGRTAAGERGGTMPLLVVSWALLEGAAILSGALFLVVGSRALVYWGAGTLALGMLLTFPRQDWFA